MLFSIALQTWASSFIWQTHFQYFYVSIIISILTKWPPLLYCNNVNLCDICDKRPHSDSVINVSRNRSVSWQVEKAKGNEQRRINALDNQVCFYFCLLCIFWLGSESCARLVSLFADFYFRGRKVDGLARRFPLAIVRYLSVLCSSCLLSFYPCGAFSATIANYRSSRVAWILGHRKGRGAVVTCSSASRPLRLLAGHRPPMAQDVLFSLGT